MAEPSSGPAWVPARASVRLVKRREVDWGTTIIAAGSFLFHFGAFSAIYSDWADAPIDDDLVISQLVDEARALPTAPDVEQPDTTEASRESEQKPAAAVSRTETRGEKGAPTRGSTPALTGRPDSAAIANELDRMNVAMLAALRSNGPSTERVLDAGTVPFAELDAAAGRAVAARPGLAFDAAGPSTRPGGSQTLADLGNQGRNEGPTGRGRAAPTKISVPAYTNKCEPGKVCDPAVSDVPNAAGVIAGLQGMFRRCYQNGLDRESPDMEGSVRVTARIGPNGEVTSTSVSVSGSISGTVASCIASKVQGAQFSAPTNGQGAVLVVPVGLKKQ